jgi:hypothetical protein
MSRAVVLEEIALVPHHDGRFWLYIGHPSRLKRVIDEGASTRRFPASLLSALEDARRRFDTWNGEMETIFDARWREALEPPQRILFNADGTIEQIDEVFGVTWAKLQAALRLKCREVHADQRAASAGQADEALTQFAQTFHNTESWVRLGHRLGRSMATIEGASR